MDNIGKKLEEIMNDPDTMKQIMDVASSLGLSGQFPDIPAQEMPQQMMQQVSDILQQTETKEKRQQNLIRALLPYLHPRRQARLERAMQLSHLSRLAGAAMRNGTAIQQSAQKGDAHV